MDTFLGKVGDGFKFVGKLFTNTPIYFWIMVFVFAFVVFLAREASLEKKREQAAIRGASEVHKEYLRRGREQVAYARMQERKQQERNFRSKKAEKYPSSLTLRFTESRKAEVVSELDSKLADTQDMYLGEDAKQLAQELGYPSSLEYVVLDVLGTDNFGFRYVGLVSASLEGSYIPLARKGMIAK